MVLVARRCTPSTGPNRAPDPDRVRFHPAPITEAVSGLPRFSAGYLLPCALSRGRQDPGGRKFQ